LSLPEYLNSIESERERIVLINRFDGFTLGNLSVILNITRERIRQLEIKAIKKMPKLKEDNYKNIFSKYNLSIEEFSYAFNEPKRTYRYLQSRFKKGNISIDQFIKDKNIDLEIRERAKEIILKDYLIIGKNRLKKDKNEILNYILKTYCEYEIGIDELWKKYQGFLKDLHLEGRKDLSFNKKYFETSLSNSDKILWKLGKKLRYYDCTKISAKKIYDSLNLSQIKDTELSTLKLFRDYENIMYKWDIRDEYELHNLMKKVIKENDKYDIKFHRMPNIEIGVSNRENQVIELLKELAPIEIFNFTKEYEERYGVRAETVQANYLGCVEKYYNDGILDAEHSEMTSSQIEILKANLSKDIYTIKEVSEIIQRLFCESNIKRILSYDLKKLGFRTNHYIIYSDKYSSAEKFFKSKILEREEVDLNQLDDIIVSNQAFYRALQNLKENLYMLEISPKKFINISKLKEKRINKLTINDYVEKLYDFVGDEIFTIEYVRKKGFKHELDKLCFDNCFYSSILSYSGKFSVSKFKGERLLKKGKEKINIHILIDYVSNKFEYLSSEEIKELINDEYGLEVY
ncbi:MAG: hypothetical protein LBR30_07190, partial [Clostridioides sp.]|jgi:ribosomal protein L7/L12|nr:hypothetical protein [Clostridioides sp.]